MSIDLSGKAVAITGASSGIGAATALSCARAGMAVALLARRADKLGGVRARIEAEGGRALAVTGSVDDPEDCARLVEEAEAALGPLYAVIANAGYGVEQPSWSMPEDAIRAMFETNFYGSLRTVRPALPGMLERGSGHVVFVSSCLSKIGIPHYAAYCATKAAQDHFARAMRHELRAKGVAVSSIHPIGTRTEFFDTAAGRSPEGARLLDGGGERFMQPASKVADAIVRRLRSGKGAEVWTSLPMRVTLGAAAMAPGLTDAVLGRMYERRTRGRG
jgi:short-subunit dehydrogenase